MTSAQFHIHGASITPVSMLSLAIAEQGFEYTHAQMCITLEWTADEKCCSWEVAGLVSIMHGVGCLDLSVSG